MALELRAFPKGNRSVIMFIGIICVLLYYLNRIVAIIDHIPYFEALNKICSVIIS